MTNYVALHFIEEIAQSQNIWDQGGHSKGQYSRCVLLTVQPQHSVFLSLHLLHCEYLRHPTTPPRVNIVGSLRLDKI